jgi:hypothetical protein
VFDRLGPERVRAGARSFGRETGGGWYDCFWAMVYGEAGDLARVVADERQRFAAGYQIATSQAPARSHAVVIMETFDLTLLDVAMLVLLFDSCNRYLADRVNAWLAARKPVLPPPNQSVRTPWRSNVCSEPLPYVPMPAVVSTAKPEKAITFAECLVAEGAPWQA